MTNTRRRPDELRSHKWFGAKDLRSFGHRSRTLQMGYSREDFADKPVIGIINTWSDINPCHAHFRTRAEEVKKLRSRGLGMPRAIRRRLESHIKREVGANLGELGALRDNLVLGEGRDRHHVRSLLRQNPPVRAG